MQEPKPKSEDPEDNLVRSKSPDQVRRMFHDIAPTYDFLNHLLSLNVDRLWRRFAARKLIGAATQSVLDVCCGTGDLALALARRAYRIAATEPRIIASDFTPAMVSRAREKFAAADFAGGTAPVLDACVADTTRLPFEDSQFDLVTVAFGIRNVVDVEAGLAEMTRVCRTGGHLAILEFSHPSNPVFRGLYNWYFFQVLPRVGSLLTGTRAYMYLPKSVARFPDTGEFAAILHRIAGGTVQPHRLTFGIATLYVATVRKNVDGEQINDIT